MGAGSQQFLLLLKKNWLLQKRKKVVTALEIGLPALFALILLIIRQQVDQTFYRQPTNWSSFAADDLRDDFIPIGREDWPMPLQFWRIAYTPNNTVTNELMVRMAARLDFRIIPTPGLGFDSEEEMLEVLSIQNNRTLAIMGGIVFNFDETTSLPDHVNYTIRLRAEQFFGRGARVRFTSSSDWYTSFTFPATPPGFGPRQRNQTDGGLPGYAREGFLALMRALDMAIVNMKNPNNDTEVNDVEVRLQRHPFPPFVEDPMILVLQGDFTFIILISFIVTAPNICKDIVLEKERKLREMMKMMGLKLWMNWISWFVKYIVFLLISVSLMTFFYHLNLGINGAVITYTHWSITWVFIFIYAISVVMFCFMVSTWFSKASSAAAAGGILFLVMYLPTYFYQFRYNSLSLAEKLAPSFSMNVAMSFGCVQFAIYEAKGIGVQWSNLFKPVSVDDNFSMGIVWIVLIVDSFIYGGIAWYCDHLLPGEYGIPEKWYFPFTKKFWCGPPPNGASVHAMDEDAEHIDRGERAEFFEDTDMNNGHVGVKIRNLTRAFKRNGESTNAVDKLSLDMYEGQITALLGHNGAGKTTTMFMLTGFLSPTSGTAYINGHDIRVDLKGVRESLGLCPQHDVLFDTLTVEEHLGFFAQLKGLPKSEVKDEVRKMIEVLHLEDKTKNEARSLSGGMKRKLCVGIALIGGSKVVILDEPTSGMDPEARRQTWDILKSQREGRTMLLSTHFMDEADYLGDRIAIMAEGVAQCEGTSLFLKGKYGVGYHMTIVKAPSCNVAKLTQVVKSYVPDAEVESNISAELSFVLPSDSSHRFEELFEDMEKNKVVYGINSYGASVTTMEEVFLKVGEDSDLTLKDRLQFDKDANSDAFANPAYEPDQPANESGTSLNGATTEKNGSVTNGMNMNGSVDSGMNGVHVENGGQAPTVFGAEFERNEGFALMTQQFRAMFEKRVIHTLRNKLVTIIQLGVPLFFVIVACAIVKTVPGPREPPSVEMGMGVFRDPVAPYVTDNGTLNVQLGKLYDEYLKTIVEMRNLNVISDDYDPSVDAYLAEFATENFEQYVESWMTAASIKENETTGADVFIGHFNNEAYHTPAITTNIIDNVLMRYALGEGHNVTVSNHPLPRSASNKIEEEWNTSLVLSFIISYNVTFGMAFLAGTFIVFLIKEREVKSKHCQFVSGVHVINFWASTMIWDMINFLIPCLCLLLVYIAFGIDPYFKGANSAYTLLTFFVYGISILPCIYLFSFVFSVPSSGYVWVTVLNILIGTIAIIVVGVLMIPDLGLVEVGKALDWVFFVILPNYAFENCMQYIYYNYETIRVCDQLYSMSEENGRDLCEFLDSINATNPCCLDNCGDYCAQFQTNYLAWDYPGIGKGLTMMFIQGTFFLIWIFIAESSTAKQMKQRAVAGANRPADVPAERHQYSETNGAATGGPPSSGADVSLHPVIPHIEEDSDVTTERERILYTPIQEQTDSLVIRELKKYYGSFLAVDKLSVGIPDGECFGLLGVNGAGKTTTFKMLTGDETITAGEAYLEGYSVNSEIKKVRQKLGYCPQFDALIEQMTCKETLRMYGRLRGIDEKSLPKVVETLIHNLMLDDHADKQAGTLSGGNKRKLSTAIALIGDPPLVFLDEPTTGMDPVARRMLWDTLTKVRASGRTLVLTSHSMEECEALCTRIAIMVNGQFKCLGSPQHLKTKFGKGYTVMVKVKGGPEEEVLQRTQAVMHFIESSFSNSVLKDLHQGLVHYQITDVTVSWAKVFGTMERAKEEYQIEDYSVSQTTLEQVFINFARAQQEPKEDSLKCKTKCCNCFKFFCLCGCCCDDEPAAEIQSSHL